MKSLWELNPLPLAMTKIAVTDILDDAPYTSDKMKIYGRVVINLGYDPGSNAAPDGG